MTVKARNDLHCYGEEAAALINAELAIAKTRSDKEVMAEMSDKDLAYAIFDSLTAHSDRKTDNEWVKDTIYDYCFKLYTAEIAAFLRA